MRVLIDRENKHVKFDATGGTFGPVTTAGQVMSILSRRHADIIEGWYFSFYPEEKGTEKIGFSGGVRLISYGCFDVAREIAELLKNTCGECGQALPIEELD